MEISEQVYKGQTPYKKYLGQMPTVKFISGREREKKPPRVLTPRRSALASARENVFSTSKKTTGADNTCLLYSPGHYSE